MAPLLLAGKSTGFETPSWPSSTSTRIILIGDTGQVPVDGDPHKMNAQDRASLRTSLAREKADAIVDLGDLFYWKTPKCRASDTPQTSGEYLDAHLYDHVGGLDTPVFLILGNHDIGPVSEHLKRRIFGNESGKRSEARERCYELLAELHDDIHFPNTSYGIDFGPIRMATLHTSAPYRHWESEAIADYLAEEPEDWTLLAGHHVLKTGCDKQDENVVLPWLSEHNVQPDLYANGHAHLLELGSFEGITAITSGSGSKRRIHGDCDPLDTSGVVWGVDAYGYALLEATASTIHIRYKNIEGEELFCWTQEKGKIGRPCSRE